MRAAPCSRGGLSQLCHLDGGDGQGQAGAVVLNYGVQKEQGGELQSALFLSQEGGEDRHAVG